MRSRGWHYCGRDVGIIAVQILALLRSRGWRYSGREDDTIALERLVLLRLRGWYYCGSEVGTIAVQRLALLRSRGWHYSAPEVGIIAVARLALLRRVLAIPVRNLGTKTVSTLRRFRFLYSVPIGKYWDLRNKVTAVSFHIFSRSFIATCCGEVSPLLQTKFCPSTVISDCIMQTGVPRTL